MAASTDQVKLFDYVSQGREKVGTVVAGQTLWSDTAVFSDAAAGGFTGVINAGANPFVGFTRENYVAATTARVSAKLRVELTITGTATSVGAIVYASDNNTFTFTSTNNTRIGVAAQFQTTNTFLVDLD